MDISLEMLDMVYTHEKNPSKSIIGVSTLDTITAYNKRVLSSEHKKNIIELTPVKIITKPQQIFAQN